MSDITFNITRSSKTFDVAAGLASAAAVAKLAGIEAGADVTDATNVAAAGALMAANNLSEVTAATARGNLGLGTAAVVDTGTTSGTIPVLGSSGLPAVGASQVTGLADSQVADPAVVDVSGDVAAGEIAHVYTPGTRLLYCDLGAAEAIEITGVTGLANGGGSVLTVRYETSGAGITYTFPAGTVIHGDAPAAAGENEVQFDRADDGTLHAYLIMEGATA